MDLTRRRRLLTLVFAYGVVAVIYGVIGTATASGPLHSVETTFDSLVPFEPFWVLIYALVFLQAVAPATTVGDQRVMDRTAVGYLSMYTVAVPLWVVYPVTVPRPPVEIVDVWTYGVALTRFVDPPSNCFPSMHVALSAFATLVVLRHDRWMGALLATTTAAIWYSTMALDQHWAADGILAIGLALVTDRLVFSLRPLPSEAFRPIPRRWHFVWIGAYVVGVLVLMSGWWLGWVPVDQLPPNVERW